MFFSSWSSQSSIQRASMDGSNKETLHSTDMIQPNDISLDIPNQLIYWTDGYTSNIQYSNYSGLNRGILTQLPATYIFGLTLDSYLVFFAEWGNNTIQYLHKLDDQSPVLTINDNFTTNAGGIVLVYPDKQTTGYTVEWNLDPNKGHIWEVASLIALYSKVISSPLFEGPLSEVLGLPQWS